MLTLYIADYASVPVVRCSPPSWMVHLALAEKGIAHSVVRLDFAHGEHRTPEMLARNPRGTVPVLTDGDIAVHETLAILEYLEFAHPVPSLLPAGTAARARALTRLHESGTLKDRGMALFAGLMRGEDSVEAGEAFTTELACWDTYLANRTWVAGHRIGLADLAVFAYVACAVQLGLKLGGWSHLAAFYNRMRMRSSVRATWPETWNTPPPDAPLWDQRGPSAKSTPTS